VTLSLTRWVQAVRSLVISPINAKDPALARLFDGPPPASGVAVTEWTALNYSAVWAAVSLISSTVGSLPLKLYKRLPNGGKEPYTNHKLYQILHDEPNPEMTSMVFRETMQAHVLMWGNAYALIQRDGVGKPAALWPQEPQNVRPFKNERDQLEYEVINARGVKVFVPASEMLHIPGLGFDGVTGSGVDRAWFG
jgi:HK97 family phage portal protein